METTLDLLKIFGELLSSTTGCAFEGADTVPATHKFVENGSFDIPFEYLQQKSNGGYLHVGWNYICGKSRLTATLITSTVDKTGFDFTIFVSTEEQDARTEALLKPKPIPAEEAEAAKRHLTEMLSKPGK